MTAPHSFPDLAGPIRQIARDLRTITCIVTKVTKAIPFGDGPEARVSAVLSAIAHRHPRLLDHTATLCEKALANEVGR
jgi:hypothetical protein